MAQTAEIQFNQKMVLAFQNRTPQQKRSQMKSFNLSQSGCIYPIKEFSQYYSKNQHNSKTYEAESNKNIDNDHCLQNKQNQSNYLQIPLLNITKQSSFPSSPKDFEGYDKRKYQAPSFLKKNIKNANNLSSEQPFNIKQLMEIDRMQKSDELFINKQFQQNKIQIQNETPLLRGRKNQYCKPLNSERFTLKKEERDQHPSCMNLLSLKPQNQNNQRNRSLIVRKQLNIFSPNTKISKQYISSKMAEFNPHQSLKFSCKNFKNPQAQSKLFIDKIATKKNSKQKIVIPSFIKLKQKKNEGRKSSGNQTVTTTSSRNNSIQNFNNKSWKLSDFQIKQRIGKGAFGDVYVARQKLCGLVCAIKKISKKRIRERGLQDLVIRQIKIQFFLYHKNITDLYGIFEDDQNVYMIMQYLSEGSLAQKFHKKKCPQQQVGIYIRQICQGLKQMHIDNIIHRDIKLENIFIHEGILKIGDFGCSIHSNLKRNTLVGSLAYISPQQLNNEQYDDKIDVWSLGVLCYELLTGKSPFEDDLIKIAKQQKQPRLSKLKFPTNIQISLQAKDFIKNLLQQNPQNRMNINDAIRHEFIMKNNSIQNLMVF